VDPPVSSPAPLAEITLDECLIDQGTTAPTSATGGDFTTITAGRLTVGSDTAYPPFGDIRNGEAVGFDIDLITEVAERIGDLEVEVVAGPLDATLQALAADELDVVISAVTIRQDRKQTVDFTGPYLVTDQALTIRTIDAGAINGVEDLDGRIVGVQSGRTAEACAVNALEERYGAAEVHAHETVVDAFDDLAAGQVDAVLSDLRVANHMVEERVGFAVAQVVRTKEKLGIAVSRRNPDLREASDGALSDMLEDGTYDALFGRWFRED
jgi:ABC-type amino acid transport substrate-binding protein